MTEQRFETPRPVRLEVTVPTGDVEVATVDGAESTVTLRAHRSASNRRTSSSSETGSSSDHSARRSAASWAALTGRSM